MTKDLLTNFIADRSILMGSEVTSDINAGNWTDFKHETKLFRSEDKGEVSSLFHVVINESLIKLLAHFCEAV